MIIERPISPSSLILGFVLIFDFPLVAFVQSCFFLRFCARSSRRRERGRRARRKGEKTRQPPPAVYRARADDAIGARLYTGARSGAESAPDTRLCCCFSLRLSPRKADDFRPFPLFAARFAAHSERARFRSTYRLPDFRAPHPGSPSSHRVEASCEGRCASESPSALGVDQK